MAFTAASIIAACVSTARARSARPRLRKKSLLRRQERRAVEACSHVGVGYLVCLELRTQQAADHLAQQQFIGAEPCQQRRIAHFGLE